MAFMHKAKVLKCLSALSEIGLGFWDCGAGAASGLRSQHDMGGSLKQSPFLGPQNSTAPL